MNRYWFDAYKMWDPQILEKFDPEVPTHPLLRTPGMGRAEWDGETGRWIVP